MNLLEVACADQVMTITLCDEPRRNALSDELLVELLEAIEVANTSDDVRVVVLTNRGSVFCAGAHLAERSSPTPREKTRVELAQLFQLIQHSPKPFVGRLAGHCVAGGVGLAAVMDISVAIDTATFGFSEVRLGVAPAIIAVVCLPKMRRGDAQNAFLRAQRFSAREAVRLGLITTSVARDELDVEVSAIVNDLLAGEPHALALTKSLARTLSPLSETEAFDWAGRESRRLFRSDEAREGITAFFEKRPASWVRKLPGTEQ